MKHSLLVVKFQVDREVEGQRLVWEEDTGSFGLECGKNSGSSGRASYKVNRVKAQNLKNITVGGALKSH